MSDSTVSQPDGDSTTSAADDTTSSAEDVYPPPPQLNANGAITTAADAMAVTDDSEDATLSDLDCDPAADLQAGIAEAAANYVPPPPSVSAYEGSYCVQAPSLEPIAEHEILDTTQSAAAAADEAAAAVQAAAYDAASSSSSYAQPPKLEPIAEHEILETTPASATIAVGAGGVPVSPEEVAEYGLMVDHAVDGVGGAAAAIAGSDLSAATTPAAVLFQAGAFDDEDWTSMQSMSRQGSVSLRKDSGAAGGASSRYYYVNALNDLSSTAAGVTDGHPLLLQSKLSSTVSAGGIAPNLSEPALPRHFFHGENVGGMYFFKRVSHFVGRNLFGSTAVTPSDSVQSLEFGGDDGGGGGGVSSRDRGFGAEPVANSSVSQSRFLRRAHSSRQSVSSDASTYHAGGIGSRNRVRMSARGAPRRAPADPAGRPVSRSRRFLIKGTAGFLHTKGTSAISLRPPERSNGLPSPCGECPYCRRYFRMGEPRSTPYGPSCPCRICVIICENAPGAPPLLKLQGATRKGKAPGGLDRHHHIKGRDGEKISMEITTGSVCVGGGSVTASAGVAGGTAGGQMRRNISNVGMFCEHCSQSGMFPTDGRCSRFSLTTQTSGGGNTASMAPPIQPFITIDQYNHVHHHHAHHHPPPSTTGGDPPDMRSVDTSIESLFFGPHGGTNRGRTGRDLSQMSIASGISVASAATQLGPMCRICHLTGEKDEEILISPCRCLGTLQYVHMSCLVHWLEICNRKLRRPPVCELCAYRYRRRRILRVKGWQWPGCRSRDKCLHVLCVVSATTMVVCALATIVCFKLEKQYGVSYGVENKKEDVELHMIEVVTLVAGVLFFLGFFIAMYSEVKAKVSLYKYVSRAWDSNHEWLIEDYHPDKDYAYIKRLTELKRRPLTVDTGQDLPGGIPLHAAVGDEPLQSVSQQPSARLHPHSHRGSDAGQPATPSVTAALTPIGVTASAAATTDNNNPVSPAPLSASVSRKASLLVGPVS